MSMCSKKIFLMSIYHQLLNFYQEYHHNYFGFIFRLNIFCCFFNLDYLSNCQFFINPSKEVASSSSLRLFFRNKILLVALLLTTDRSKVKSITEFITMCIWLQANNFHLIYIFLFKTT